MWMDKGMPKENRKAVALGLAACCYAFQPQHSLSEVSVSKHYIVMKDSIYKVVPSMCNEGMGE